MIKWLENKIREVVSEGLENGRKPFVNCDKCGVVLVKAMAKKVEIDRYGGLSISTSLPCVYYCDRHAPKYDLKIDNSSYLSGGFGFNGSQMISYDRYYKSHIEVDENGKPVKEKR